MTEVKVRRNPNRRVWMVALLAALGILLAGCGTLGTEPPPDAAPADSQVSNQPSDAEGADDADDNAANGDDDGDDDDDLDDGDDD